MRLWAILVFCSVTARAADDWPVSLRTISPGNVWTNVGCIVDPDTVTTVFVVMGTTSTAAQINTQLNSCPSNAMVVLTNGTFSSLAGDITIQKNGVVLSGLTNANGLPTTILNGGKVRMGKALWPDPSADPISSINISSGLTEGSTSITLASSANADFAVGDLFAIDQTDDGTNVRTSTTGWAHRSGRSYIVLRKCTSKAGAVIGFEPPLVGKYWSAGQDPEAWGWSSYSGATLLTAGVQHLQFIGSTSSYMIEAGPMDGGWIRNLRISVGSSGAGSARIRLAYCIRTTVTDCIIPDSPIGSSSAYAIYPTVGSFLDISHNIVTNYGLFLPSISMSTSFIGYNTCIGPFPYPSPDTFLAEYVFPHGGHDHDNLYEGNWIGATFDADGIFGGNSGNSGLVRNRIMGWYAGKTSNRVPITMEPTGMVNYTILGNVLGAEEYHSSYSQIYNIDGSTVGLIRTNNYNTADNGVNSAEAHGGNTTANSYRFSSRPAKFGDTEGVWPPYGPESTQGTNTLSYTNIPSGFRAYFGFWPDGAGGSSVGERSTVSGSVTVGGKVTISAQ